MISAARVHTGVCLSRIKLLFGGALLASRRARRCFLILHVVCFSCGLLAQNPQLRTKNAGQFPTVVFTSVLWIADPPYYSIAIDSSGAATYLSAPASIENTGVPYTIEFHATERTRRMVFTIAPRLDFLAGSDNNSVPQPEKIRVQTLSYTDDHSSNQFSYTVPSGPDLGELTTVFEELSETLECGRKLAYFQQHDRSGVDSQLEWLQSQMERHRLREFQALVPVLRSVSSDGRLSPTTRSQAEKLLLAAQRWH